MKTAAAIGIIAATLGFSGVAPAAAVSGPRIQFATPEYDFGRIKGGDVVQYSYVFTNVGDGLLEVTDVQAHCGCTTAGDWNRKVEPGKTGSIPIQFNSGAFNGHVEKTVTVTCNDTNQPTVVLQFNGTIWKPVEVTPQFAVMNVTADSPSNATTVRIVNNEETPLTLSAPEGNNRAFAAELKTNEPGKQFELAVRTVPPLTAGTIRGQFTLKTSSTNLPVINVTVWANVQAAVEVMPSQITLPAGPLANRLPSIITIRNSGTNALALTDPAVNVKDVDVQLKAVQPGRFFTLTVSFPAGFEVARGQKVELSVKSNHPQFPIIKVPVIQAARPTPVPAPAGRQVGQPTPPSGAGGH